MEGDGTSIFQGADTLHLHPETCRLEEEEALEDQQRRHKEIQNILTTAFDDLQMDDDDDDDGEESAGSIVSEDSQVTPTYLNSEVDNHNPAYLAGGGDSNIPEHYKHCYRTSPGGLKDFDENEEYRQAGFNSTEQLQVLYEVRVREVERLTNEIEKWRRQATLNEADKEQAQLSLTQQTNLLSTYKGKNAELQEEVTVLKQKITNLEKSNSNFSNEVAMYQAMATDLQQQVTMLQRGSGPDPQTDELLNELRKKHQKEVQNMQEQVEQAANKLASKTGECEELMRKVMETARSRDALLVEKGDTINRLSQSLEDSQRQIQKLMGSDEVIQRYEATDLLEDVSDTDSMILLGIGKGKKMSASAADTIAQLKNELKRCIAGHKLKRQEIVRLHNQLDQERENIKLLQDQEIKLGDEINGLKEGNVNVLKELKLRENVKAELETENLRLTERVSMLENHITQLQQQIEMAEMEKMKEISEHGDEYLRFHDATVAKLREERNEKLNIQIQYLSSKLDEALMENENVKKLYVEVCGMKDVALADLNAARAEREVYARRVVDEIDKAKEEVRKELLKDLSERPNVRVLESECRRLHKELDDLRHQIENLHMETVDLQARLQHEQSQNERLEMKIKDLERPKVSAKDASTNVSFKQTGSDPDAEQQKLQKVFDAQLAEITTKHVLEMKEHENHIKDEAVKFFTAEIDEQQLKHEEVVRKLEESKSELKEATDAHVQFQLNAEKALQAMVTKVLVSETQLATLKRKFEENETRFTACKTEFLEMRDKYQKSYNKALNKYRSAKTKLSEYESHVKHMKVIIHKEFEERDAMYRESIAFIQARFQNILDKMEIEMKMDTVEAQNTQNTNTVLKSSEPPKGV